MRADARRDRGGAGQSALPPTNLPEPVSELIGRDDELSEILNLCRRAPARHADRPRRHRQDAARSRTWRAELLPQFADGVWLAEFAPLADPGLVPATVAARGRARAWRRRVSARRVAQALAGRRLLLVLDTCEHVIDAAAALAEAVLRAGSAVRIIATSREPLRAEEEWVYPVPPLAVPRRRCSGCGRSAAIRRGSAVRRAGAGGGAALRARPALSQQ